MTKLRDPTSVCGAWHETCQLLGWGYVAGELEVSERTIRLWGDEDSGKQPPAKAQTWADIELKARGHPPLNIIAFGIRIGDPSLSPVSALREVEGCIQKATRSVDDCDSRDWSLPDAMEEVAKINERISDLIRHIRKRHDREAGAQQRPPARELRQIIGGRDV